MLDFLLLGFAIVLWGCYCCRRRNGIQGLRRVPIISEPKEKMTEEERLALIEKQLVTVTIGGGVQSLRNLITSAQSLYEANCCNCAGSITSSGHAEDEKDCENEEHFNNDTASQRSRLSRTWSAASVTIAQHRQEECIICFEEYKEGDEICWAKTDQCQHVFHKNCAVEWLKQHDECPLCRINIILAKTVTYEQDDDDADDNDENEIDAPTDLERGVEAGHGDDGNADTITNENVDIEETNEEKTSISEVPQLHTDPSSSSLEEDTLSQTKPEGYFEDDHDEEMATSSKEGAAPETGAGASDSSAATPLELNEMSSKSVDFTGSIRSFNGE